MARRSRIKPTAPRGGELSADEIAELDRIAALPSMADIPDLGVYELDADGSLIWSAEREEAFRQGARDSRAGLGVTVEELMEDLRRVRERHNPK